MTSYDQIIVKVSKRIRGYTDLKLTFRREADIISAMTNSTSFFSLSVTIVNGNDTTLIPIIDNSWSYNINPYQLNTFSFAMVGDQSSLFPIGVPIKIIVTMVFNSNTKVLRFVCTEGSSKITNPSGTITKIDNARSDFLELVGPVVTGSLEPATGNRLLVRQENKELTFISNDINTVIEWILNQVGFGGIFISELPRVLLSNIYLNGQTAMTILAEIANVHQLYLFLDDSFSIIYLYDSYKHVNDSITITDRWGNTFPIDSNSEQQYNQIYINGIQYPVADVFSIRKFPSLTVEAVDSPDGSGTTVNSQIDTLKTEFYFGEQLIRTRVDSTRTYLESGYDIYEQIFYSDQITTYTSTGEVALELFDSQTIDYYSQLREPDYGNYGAYFSQNSGENTYVIMSRNESIVTYPLFDPDQFMLSTGMETAYVDQIIDNKLISLILTSSINHSVLLIWKVLASLIFNWRLPPVTTTITGYQTIRWHKLPAVGEPIPWGSINAVIVTPANADSTAGTYDGHTPFFGPGIYYPEVTSSATSDIFGIASITNVSGTGFNIITQSDALLGNVQGVQVTGSVGTQQIGSCDFTLTTDSIPAGINDDSSTSNIVVNLGVFDWTNASGTAEVIFDDGTTINIPKTDQTVPQIVLEYNPESDTGKWSIKFLSGYTYNIPLWKQHSSYIGSGSIIGNGSEYGFINYNGYRVTTSSGNFVNGTRDNPEAYWASGVNSFTLPSGSTFTGYEHIEKPSFDGFVNTQATDVRESSIGGLIEWTANGGAAPSESVFCDNTIRGSEIELTNVVQTGNTITCDVTLRVDVFSTILNNVYTKSVIPGTSSITKSGIPNDWEPQPFISFPNTIRIIAIGVVFVR